MGSVELPSVPEPGFLKKIQGTWFSYDAVLHWHSAM
jgi:hypothetical protein